MTAIVSDTKFLSDGRLAEAGPGSGKNARDGTCRGPCSWRVYAQNRAAHDGVNGLGQRVGLVGDGKGYRFPLLWGPDSFNDGGGMDRLIGATKIIHDTVRDGVTW